MQKNIDRKKSVIVFGLAEEDDGNLTEKVANLLDEISVTANLSHWSEK